MRATGDKQNVYNQIRAALGLRKAALGPGAKEHKPTLLAAARRVGIATPNSLSKQQLGAKIVATAGLRWDRSCESRGQTITRKGLLRVLAALRHPRPRPSPSVRRRFGKPYRHRKGGIDKNAAATIAKLDPEALDRATKAHQDLLERVEWILKRQRIKPLGPHTAEPSFDMGWRASGTRVVLEAKSTTKQNRVHQERLGVGQLLEYLDCLKQLSPEPVRGVLAVSGQPRRETLRLCKYLGIVVVWPPKLGDLLRPVLGP